LSSSALVLQIRLWRIVFQFGLLLQDPDRRIEKSTAEAKQSVDMARTYAASVTTPLRQTGHFSFVECTPSFC